MKKVAGNLIMLILCVGCATQPKVDLVAQKIFDAPYAEQALFEVIPIVLSSETPNSEFPFD